MGKSQAKLPTQLNKIATKLWPYFFEKSFPFQIAMLSVLCYVTEQTLVAIGIISILAAIIFILYKNTAPIMPLLFMVVMNFKDYSIMNGIVPYLLLSPAILAFVLRFFIHQINWKVSYKFFIPLIFVTLSYAFAGITRDDYDFSFAIAYLISLGPVMMLIFFFFSSGFEKENNFCLKKYLCYSLLATGLAMIAQIIYAKYVPSIYYPWQEMGWGNVNGCAAFLLLSIPACFYLLTKTKNIIPLIFCLLSLYTGLLISGSDAALAFALVYTPFLIYYTYRHLYRTQRQIFLYAVVIVVVAIATAVIVLVSLYGFQGTLDLLQIQTSDNGREPRYKKAIELFRENPIFGYGFQYNEPGTIASPIRIYNFHSTLFHVLATMGTFGLIAYLLYFIIRFAILMRSYSPFTTTMLVGFILLESYAMVDTGEFNAIPLMSAVTVMLAVVDWATKKGNATSALPLATNKSNGYYF